MSAHNDNHHQVTETKPVSFRTPLIFGLVVIALILLLVSTCDNKHHQKCEHEGKCTEECATKEHGEHSGANEHAVVAEHDAVAVVAEEIEVAGTLDSLGNFLYNTGEEVGIEVSGKQFLSVGKNSTEAKLYSFLSNADVHVDTVDKTQGWISLDRVYFENGKSVLTKESQKQLTNLALILKTFPTATVKLGGYTDNSGSVEANTKISAQRADIALKAIAKNGVDAKQLIKAEGYGPLHPIASNDTPEGKAQNRRVDIRVTKK